jgi:hypothetical protein
MACCSVSEITQDMKRYTQEGFSADPKTVSHTFTSLLRLPKDVSGSLISRMKYVPVLPATLFSNRIQIKSIAIIPFKLFMVAQVEQYRILETGLKIRKYQ